MGPEENATRIPMQDISERLRMGGLPLQPVSRAAEARPAADPATLVVDADCRCHARPILFIACPAVISAAATVDCRPTIAALARSGAAEPMIVAT